MAFLEHPENALHLPGPALGDVRSILGRPGRIIGDEHQVGRRRHEYRRQLLGSAAIKRGALPHLAVNQVGEITQREHRRHHAPQLDERIHPLTERLGNEHAHPLLVRPHDFGDGPRERGRSSRLVNNTNEAATEKSSGRNATSARTASRRSRTPLTKCGGPSKSDARSTCGLPAPARHLVILTALTDGRAGG